MRKLLATIAIFFIFLSCGFKPIYKVTSDGTNIGNYSVEFTNEVKREIMEEVKSTIGPSENPKYKALLKIYEDLSPLIVNTNGTVAKYRIEIEIKYELLQLDSNEVISTGTTRGFAQYDVTGSEIVNEDTKKSMTKIATKNAVQLMTSRIQSRISRQMLIKEYQLEKIIKDSTQFLNILIYGPNEGLVKDQIGKLTKN